LSSNCFKKKDEKREHAATHVRLAEVVDRLEAVMAEFTNMQLQMQEQKEAFDKQ